MSGQAMDMLRHPAGPHHGLLEQQERSVSPFGAAAMDVSVLRARMREILGDEGFGEEFAAEPEPGKWEIDDELMRRARDEMFQEWMRKELDEYARRAMQEDMMRELVREFAAPPPRDPIAEARRDLGSHARAATGVAGAAAEHAPQPVKDLGTSGLFGILPALIFGGQR